MFNLVLILVLFSSLLPVSFQNDVDVDFAVRYWARRYNLDELCFLRLVWLESSLDPLVVGSHGERGLAQFKEKTWDWARKRMGIGKPDFDNAFDPWINAQTAAYLLSDREGRFDGWWSVMPYCYCGMRGEPWFKQD